MSRLMGHVLFFFVCALLGLACVKATTVVAARCADGIVLAADSLKSDSGILIATRTAKKVFLLSPNTVICSVNSSGQGSTHFQQLYNELRETLQEHEGRYESPLSTTAICKVARQLVATRFPDAHAVIAGYGKDVPVSCTGDKRGAEGRVEYILSEILPGGTRMDQAVVAAGSGSTLITSLLDEALSEGGVYGIGTENKVSAEEGVGRRPSVVTTAAGVGAGAGADPFCTTISAEDSAATAAGVNLSVAEVAARLRRCLHQASRLDPHTGGDAFTVWVLSRDADSRVASDSGAETEGELGARRAAVSSTEAEGVAAPL
jgi:20S proteasome alpha/beta subunit